MNGRAGGGVSGRGKLGWCCELQAMGPPASAAIKDTYPTGPAPMMSTVLADAISAAVQSITARRCRTPGPNGTACGGGEGRVRAAHHEGVRVGRGQASTRWDVRRRGRGWLRKLCTRVGLAFLLPSVRAPLNVSFSHPSHVCTHIGPPARPPARAYLREGAFVHPPRA